MEAADPIMLSALQHWSYCPRQCALIHVEQAFDENVFTMRGNAAHERVDDPGFENFEGVRSERALPVWSERSTRTSVRARDVRNASRIDRN